MKIVHFAPFAPCACGLYEAARDMVAADLEAGHEAYLVDTGATYTTNEGMKHTPGEIGKEDKRGFYAITSANPIVAQTADVLIAHTGVPDPWFSTTQAPMLWMLHGRPRACFGPEQFGRGDSYSLMARIAKWPRVKNMITFWPYHEVYWKNIIPLEKLVVLSAPVVDFTRFGPGGHIHDFQNLGGDIDIALADSLREDVDLYEIANGALEFARNNRGVRFHFYGMDDPLRCWDYILSELRILGALGEVWARRPNIEEIYRAADIILSPHKITTRVIAEALCCGTPVIAAHGCEYATWNCDVSDTGSVTTCITSAIEELKSKWVADRVQTAKDQFSFAKYSESMEKIYANL